MLPFCDAATGIGSDRRFETVWNLQQHVKHALRNDLNEKSPLLRLPADVLHLIVHILDESENMMTLSRLRTTCRLFMATVDRACFCIIWFKPPQSLALFRESELPLPLSCKTLNWIFDPAISGSPSPVWITQLRQAHVINMRIPVQRGSPDRLADYPELQQRWLQLVTTWFRSAPVLERLSLLCVEYPPHGMEWTVPSNVFGNFAPRLRMLVIINLLLTPTPTAFQHVMVLDYRPGNGHCSRTDLQNIFISLPELKALKLRIRGVSPYDQPLPVVTAYEAPVKHSLRLLQIYIRYGIPAFIHSLIDADSAPNLMTLQCALRASIWWKALMDEVQHHMEVAFGFEITEVVIRRPSPSPPLRIQLHHDRGPEAYSMADSSHPYLNPSLYAHHPLVTTLSICQFLWPREAVIKLPALTSLTLLVGCCTQYGLATRSTLPPFDDVFLWDINSAVLDAPLLREVGIAYAQVNGWQACCAKPQHECCLRGHMIVSVEVIVHVLLWAVVRRPTLLDVVRTSGIEFYETEDRWRHQLAALTHKVEHIGPLVNVHVSLSSTMILSQFEELADTHCRDVCRTCSLADCTHEQSFRDSI